METVRSWLVANVGNPGSLRTIAQQFAINEYRLKRDFKQVYGTTVFEYLGTIRMEMAKKMLLETSMPISEIAYLAGYSSGAHFADAFRRHFNYSPIYLRKK
jgi:AraC family transcriptional activator of pyochelin receptor